MHNGPPYWPPSSGQSGGNFSMTAACASSGQLAFRPSHALDRRHLKGTSPQNLYDPIVLSFILDTRKYRLMNTMLAIHREKPNLLWCSLVAPFASFTFVKLSVTCPDCVRENVRVLISSGAHTMSFYWPDQNGPRLLPLPFGSSLLSISLG